MQPNAPARASHRLFPEANWSDIVGQVVNLITEHHPAIRVSVLFYQRCCAVRDAFFRTRKQGMGTGPSFVRAIGEVHKGCIWEENKTDGGGELRLSLPLVLP